MNDEVVGIGCTLVLLLALLVGSFGWWIARSALEASSYNRVTNSNVSTWDAMWIELRVEGNPK